MVMDRFDDELDERLGAVSRPHPEAVERICASAMASTPRDRRPYGVVLATAASAAILVGLLGLWQWPRHPAGRATANHADVGLVLIRAPDGSGAIFSTGVEIDPLPPGSGVVIAEGDPR
jgi:hypothetical protein